MDRGDSPAQIRRHEASNSVAFVEHFTALMGVGRDRPVYKLLHVGVPHRPIVVDRDCRFLGLTDMSRQSYLEQSRCAVKLVGALLDRASALGIYDSSLIIVSSDHGTDLQPLGFAGTSDSLSLRAGTVDLAAARDSREARKPSCSSSRPGGNGPISISDAPTAHIDLQPTILEILGLPGGSPDASMLERDPKQPRTRTYGMYDPRQRFPKDYLDRIDVLSIDGRSGRCGLVARAAIDLESDRQARSGRHRRGSAGRPPVSRSWMVVRRAGAGGRWRRGDIRAPGHVEGRHLRVAAEGSGRARASGFCGTRADAGSCRCFIGRA